MNKGKFFLKSLSALLCSIALVMALLCTLSLPSAAADANGSSNQQNNINTENKENTESDSTLPNGATPAPDGCILFSSSSPFTITVTSPTWLTSPNSGYLEYSTNGNTWTVWKSGATIISSNAGLLYMRGKGNTQISADSKDSAFTISGSNVHCTGNIMTLLDYEAVLQGTEPPMAEYCFASLFSECTALVTTPSMPAQNLTSKCYYKMYNDCTNLVNIPDVLPAQTVPTGAYQRMFYYCSALPKAPTIAAKEVANYGCAEMFEACKALTEVSELSATTIGNSAYDGMFEKCSGLIIAPEIAATTVGEQAFRYMFAECRALQTPPSQIHAEILPYYACYEMFKGCKSLTSVPIFSVTDAGDRAFFGTFNACLALTSVPENMFANIQYIENYCFFKAFMTCTGLKNAPKLPANLANAKGEEANTCFAWMFYDCKSLEKLPELPATTIPKYAYEGMFIGCTSITERPVLPAENIGAYAYYEMFKGCTGLTMPPKLPATTLTDSCYQNMLNGCTGIKLYSTAEETKTSGAIPWSIPVSSTTATDWGLDMLAGTGGSVTSAPSLMTTYYVAHEHTYDAVCDPQCNTCYETRTVQHKGTPTLYEIQNDGTHNICYTCCHTLVQSNITCTVNSPDTNCTTAEVCTCGRVFVEANESHALSILEKRDETMHILECTVEACTHTEAENHTHDQKSTAHKASDATCTKAATYYYTCACGAVGTATFEDGAVNENNHTNNYEYTVRSNSDGTHNSYYSCCDKLYTRGIMCKSMEAYTDCTKQEICICGYVTKAAREHDYYSEYDKSASGHRKICQRCNIATQLEGHTPYADDGSCLTPILCSVCQYETTPAKSAHTWSDTYLLKHSDKDKHYHVCTVSGCNAKDEGKAHIPNLPAATEEDAQICTVCIYTMQERLPHVHVYNEVVNDAYKISNATCKLGATYYKSCRCGDVSTDFFEVDGLDPQNHASEELEFETGSDSTHIKKHACCHLTVNSAEPCYGGTATCESLAECTACHQAYGSLLSHSYTLKMHDEEGHWNKCATCSRTTTKLRHDLDANGACNICEYGKTVTPPTDTEPPKDTDKNKGGISTGAIFGITAASAVVIITVIAVAVGAIVLIGGTVLTVALIIRARKKKKLK